MARKKRSPPSGDGAGPSRPSKRAKSTSRSVGPTSGFSENATGSSRLELEVMNRKIEELQLAFQKREELLQTEVNALKEKLSILQNPPDTNQSESEQVDHGRYDSRIIGAIKRRVYTGSKVEGQNGEFLKVAIYYNGEKVTSEPFASAKFEILVIKGDFGEKGSWTAETFQGSLVEAREEVGSILKNNSISKFASGEAVLDGLIFMDNSSWVKGKKWRLGIRLLKSDDVRVVEAISNCFRVFDWHGKASEKPHPPSLTDGVECLEKVGKKRALDLKNMEICTVKDFLQLFHSKQSRLLKILGMNSEDDESWKTMIRHAKECDVGSDLYSYRENNNMLFFYSVYELVGAEFENDYISFDKLERSKKKLVNKQKKGFYKYIKMGNIADFEMVNGQPVPIEHDPDDNAQQIDQTAEALDRQPADNTHSLSYDAMSDIRRDADQNIVSDRNADENYDLTQDETAGALGRQRADNTRSLSYDSVPDTGRDADQNIVADHNAEFSDENWSQVQEQKSVAEINLTSARENMSVEEPYQGLSFQRVDFIPSPGQTEFHFLLHTLYDDQPILEYTMYGRRATARAIIKAMCSVVRFKQYLRRDHLAGDPGF